MITCEICGKRRKPYRQSVVRLGDGSIDDIFDFCFPCTKEAERKEEKARAEEGY